MVLPKRSKIMGDQETNRQLKERIGPEEFKALQTNDPVLNKRPHVESPVTCSCGMVYCLICDSQCPKCLGIHIQPKQVVRLSDTSRPHPWLHPITYGFGIRTQ